MNIESKEELKELVEMCTSVGSLAKIMKGCYNVTLIAFDECTLTQIKEQTIHWIDKYGDEKEVPLFIYSDEPLFSWQENK